MKNFKFSILFLLFSSINGSQEESFYYVVAQQEAVKVPKSFIGVSKKKYNFLNNCAYYQKYKTTKECLDALLDQMVQTTIDAKEDYSYKTYYFNRSSHKLVIVVPPYGAQINHLIRFAGIFSETDLVIIDYCREPSWNPFATACSFMSAPKLSERKMHADQLAQVLEKAQKSGYQEIIGASQCYGAWVLLDLQISLKQSGKFGFNKLIIDSCPAGTSSLLEKFIEDPIGIITLGSKTGPWWVKFFPKIFRYPALAFTNYFYQDFSAAELLSNIDVPLLLIHNQQDFVVTNEEFNCMYQAVKHDHKAALLTPFKHLQASLKAKELYAMLVSQFIQDVLF